MKVALLLSVLLLAASTAVAQDATSTFIGTFTTFTVGGTPTVPTGTNNVAAGATFWSCVNSRTGGVEGTTTTNFVATTTSPADSGGTLSPTFSAATAVNASVFCFSYLVGANEYRTLNVTIKASGTTIINGVQTVTVGTPITTGSFVASGLTSGATTPFAAVSFAFTYSVGRAISYTVNFGDGSPIVTTPLTTLNTVPAVPLTHVYYPPAPSGATIVAACWFTDGVTTINITSPLVSFTNSPCPVGQAANSGNTTCVDCYSKCGCPCSGAQANTFCKPLGNSNPVCNCASGFIGADCALATANAVTGSVNVAGATNTSVTAGGLSVTISFQNGVVSKRVVPVGTTFVGGQYTIPPGEFTNTATIFNTVPSVAFTAELLDSNNKIVPFGEILLLSIPVSSLNLVAGTAAGNTITLYYRSGVNTYVEVTGAQCAPGICAKYGLDPTSCKSVNDFIAIIGVCGNGGNYVLAQNIANIVNPPPFGGFVTGGSITATAPTPVTPSQENQQLPNGKPSAISPAPVPTPQVLPPNTPFSPPTFSGAAIVQPIVFASFVVVILTLLVL